LLVAVLFIINAGLLCLKFAGIAGEKNMPDAGLSSCINPVPDTGPISSDRSKPDIYYIVLDEYASSDTIEKYYGYSNQGFENFLRDNGFYVSGTSVSSYVSTDLALAAVLNMEKISPDTKSKEVYRLISEDRVSAFLKNIGYKYIHIGSSMEVNKIMPVSADYYYNYFTAKRFYTDDDLSSKLVDMSILRPLFYTADWTKVQQESVYFSFDKILEVSGIKGPKYVFAHVVCPHHPFVFDMDGNPLRISDRKNWEDKSIYLGQYIYVTKLVESLIGRLLKGYRPDGGGPVVIIQSDHGPRKVPGAPDEVKYGIFNAMLLPGIENGFDIESIPQEETFKRIFGPFVKWK